MERKDRIDLDVVKTVQRAIAQSENIELMATHLTQLLVATMEIKGASLFARNVDSDELEVLGSFGLSISYINKGPVMFAKSIRNQYRGQPIVIPDVTQSELLQYPAAAQKEGIAAIVSQPITFSGKIIGVMRLYHHEKWEVSPKELDYLELLAEVTGLTMLYLRLLNTVKTITATVNEIHPVWLEP